MSAQQGWAAVPGLTEILDALAEAVTIRDPAHRIVYANQAALDHMGFASLQEIQSAPPDVIMADYIVEDEYGRPVPMEAIPSVRVLAGEPSEPLLIRTTHRSTGELAWMVLKASALRSPEGDVAASVMIIEDVTREKLAELRERFLAQATDTLMSSIDYEETLRNVAWLAVPEIADWCAVDLLDPQGARQQVVVAHADETKLALARRLRSYEPEGGSEETATLRVARTGTAEIYNDITDEMLVGAARDAEHLELLRAVGFRSVLVVPMKARGRTLGVMTLVNSDSLRRFDEGDLEFAVQLAGRGAIAVDNARLATSRHEVAITLQRSLLPDADPMIAGWEVATMYRPASVSGEIEVGGDFYDFVETESGWVVLLGDVTGRGVEAAALTSLVRHGARFLAKEGLGPSAILTRIDRALRERPGLSLCTALCLRLETGQVVLSSAGHPSPLVLHDDGSVRELSGTGPLLGGWDESVWEEHTLALDPDSTLVMYTDGVTDTRGERERFGIGRLRGVLASQAGGSPAEVLAGLESALDQFEVAGRSDDTGAVALRPSAVREPASSAS